MYREQYREYAYMMMLGCKGLNYYRKLNGLKISHHKETTGCKHTPLLWTSCNPVVVVIAGTREK